MNESQCIAEIAAIKRTFSFAFEHGLTLARAASSEGGEHCMVCLKSPTLSLKFEIDFGIVTVSFGDGLARCDWDSYGKDEAGWVSAHMLLKYLERGSPNDSREAQPRPIESLETQLSLQSARIRSHFDEVAAAFSKGRSEQWWQDFKRFETRELAERRAQLLSRH